MKMRWRKISPARIRELRGSMRISQVQFGKLVGVTGSTISSWERGKSKPDKLCVQKVLNIATTLVDSPAKKPHQRIERPKVEHQPPVHIPDPINPDVVIHEEPAALAYHEHPFVGLRIVVRSSAIHVLGEVIRQAPSATIIEIE